MFLGPTESWRLERYCSEVLGKSSTTAVDTSSPLELLFEVARGLNGLVGALYWAQAQPDLWPIPHNTSAAAAGSAAALVPAFSSASFSYLSNCSL